jgi:hypothetical protein
MEEEMELLKKRAETKQFITAGIQKTFPAYFFNLIGRGLVKIFRLKKRPHWTVDALILGMLIYLPGILVSVATGEIFHWKDIQIYCIGLGVFAYLSPIVCHVNLGYNFLPGIRDSVVDFIQSAEDLKKLEKWLNSLWSFGRWLAFMLVGGFLIGIFETFGFSYANGRFIGAGLTVLFFSIAPFFILSTYVIFYVLTFPAELAGYHLDLYESNPARSEIIQRVIHILNIYLYMVAGYVAVGTALVTINPSTRWWMYFVICLGWAPTIAQFIANQSAIRKIIVKAKWQNLNRLQKQIRALQNRNLTSVPAAEILRIHHLMDLHDRISGKPNSNLNLSTGFNLLNQLMLPLLGLLLGNMDKLIRMITQWTLSK